MSARLVFMTTEQALPERKGPNAYLGMYPRKALGEDIYFIHSGSW